MSSIIASLSRLTMKPCLLLPFYSQPRAAEKLFVASCLRPQPTGPLPGTVPAAIKQTCVLLSLVCGPLEPGTAVAAQLGSWKHEAGRGTRWAGTPHLPSRGPQETPRGMASPGPRLEVHPSPAWPVERGSFSHVLALLPAPLSHHLFIRCS